MTNLVALGTRLRCLESFEAIEGLTPTASAYMECSMPYALVSAFGNAGVALRTRLRDYTDTPASAPLPATTMHPISNSMPSYSRRGRSGGSRGTSARGNSRGRGGQSGTSEDSLRRGYGAGRRGSRGRSSFGFRGTGGGGTRGGF